MKDQPQPAEHGACLEEKNNLVKAETKEPKFGGRAAGWQGFCHICEAAGRWAASLYRALLAHSALSSWHGHAGGGRQIRADPCCVFGVVINIELAATRIGALLRRIANFAS